MENQEVTIDMVREKLELELINITKKLEKLELKKLKELYKLEN